MYTHLDGQLVQTEEVKFFVNKFIKQVRFFDSFTLHKINVDNYLVFDPKIRSFEVMPEFEFKNKYIYKSSLKENEDA